MVQLLANGVSPGFVRRQHRSFLQVVKDIYGGFELGCADLCDVQHVALSRACSRTHCPAFSTDHITQSILDEVGKLSVGMLCQLDKMIVLWHLVS